MKPFFKSIHRLRRLHRLARVEFGNDWPDFKYGDFWEVDDVWLRQLFFYRFQPKAVFGKIPHLPQYHLPNRLYCDIPIYGAGADYNDKLNL